MFHVKHRGLRIVDQGLRIADRGFRGGGVCFRFAPPTPTASRRALQLNRDFAAKALASMDKVPRRRPFAPFPSSRLPKLIVLQLQYKIVIVTS